MYLGLLYRCGECLSVCRKISEKHGRLWTHGEWSKTSPGGVRENEPAVCMYVYFRTEKWVIYGEKKKLRIETGEQAYRIAVVKTSAFEGVEQVCARVPNRLREYLTNSAFFFNFRLS